MRPVTLIVIHCSASPNGDPLFRASPGGGATITPAQIIDGWHGQRGFKRAEAARERHNPELAHIGYHWLIYRNGAIASGRSLEEVGAHVQGFNQKSVGICLVGTDRYTPEQWVSLKLLVEAMGRKYPQARVVGHRDLSPDQNRNGIVEPSEWLKTCPGFDVGAWLAAGMAPLPGHIQEA